MGCLTWRTADGPQGEEKVGAGWRVLLGSPCRVGESLRWTGPSRCQECPRPSCSWTQGQGLGPVWVASRPRGRVMAQASGEGQKLRGGRCGLSARCFTSWDPFQCQADRDRWSRGGGAPVCSLDTGRQHLNSCALPQGGDWGPQLYSREAGNLSPNLQVRGRDSGRKGQLTRALGQTSAEGCAAARWARWAPWAALRLDAGGVRLDQWRAVDWTMSQRGLLGLECRKFGDTGGLGHPQSPGPQR